jgi:acetylornithine deacetylase/succinyl-diaminopimelate desuccinylase-like protein
LSEHLEQPGIRERNLDELIELLRMPTVSAKEDPALMQGAVDWLVERLQQLGAETQLLDSTGFPIIYGEIKGDSPRSLLFYNHYDVQPPEPLEAWTSDPFEPAIRDGRLYARGSDDNKGSLMSRIHGVEAVLKERGSLPVTIKFLIEGEEESGSTSLAGTVQRHAELLKADACIWENARRDDAGSPTMTLGNKGMYSFELRVRTADADSHSGKANLYPNAIWRLVGALACMRGADGTILIKGFNESVEPMTASDEEVCRATPGNGAKQASKLGLTELLPGNDDFAVNRALFFTPSLNIQGIEGGYTGLGHKTVNPATAFARLEARLVKGQDPREVAAMIKSHLAEQGYGDVEVIGKKFGEPCYTRTDAPFVRMVQETGGRVYGRPVVVLPSSPGSGPRYVFKHQPTMPIVALGVGHADSRAHAPNENISLEDFHLTTKHVAEIIRKFGEL